MTEEAAEPADAAAPPDPKARMASLSRRRIALAASAGLILILAWWTHPWAPARRSGTFRVFLPRVEQRVELRQDRPDPPTVEVPAPRIVLRPADAGALIDAITVPGAIVLPEPGEYWLPVQARVAEGVTLNGRGGVTITGRGLMLEDAHRATLAGLTITRVKGDGVTVKRSQDVLVADSDISRASDGLLDLNGGATVTIRNTLFHDNIRGSVCGNWQAPDDGREHLTLIDVTYERVNERAPKAQDCDLVAINLTVIGAAHHYPVDLRGSSTAKLTNYQWREGKIYAPGWRGDPGTSMVIDGEAQEVVDR